MKQENSAFVPPCRQKPHNGSTSVILNGTILALTGDVTAAQNSNATTIANNAVTSAKIADGTIAAADLGSMGATATGQVLQWNGTAWAPTTSTNCETWNMASSTTPATQNSDTIYQTAMWA